MQALDSHPLLQRLRHTEFVRHGGRVSRVRPGFIEADGPAVGLGTVCELACSDGRTLQAEVSGASRQGIVLMPYGLTDGVRVGDAVSATSRSGSVLVGEGFLGRAVDGLGAALDGGPPPRGDDARRLHGEPLQPLQRAAATQALQTGVRAIDTLLTLARGQRIGVFAGSGVGKSTLVNAVARHLAADVKVVCLVGERGREAAEYWRHNVPEAERARTVLVASTSEQPAVLRARAVHLALVLAEHFRDAGRHVLFVMDSITRYAMALREIGLAIGEPPTARAYTPSVFAALPRVVERCGARADGGAITAVFSVLAESDDIEDPLSDVMRSLLDGHIVLTRSLAEQGHYPAIDVTRSVSRLMQAVAAPTETAMAQAVVAALAQYEKSRILVDTGSYRSGSSAEIDRAVALHAPLLRFVAQDLAQPVGRAEALRELAAVLGPGPGSPHAH